MPKKIFVFLFTLLSFSVAGLTQVMAEDAMPACSQLKEKATGVMLKYSLHGEANGPIFFSGINCAIKHRNKQLCAMEMISFDTTSKVHDFNTAEEIDIGRAYFWFDEKNKDAPILAFASKESAEKYGSENEGGVILDFTALTEREELK